MGLRIAIGECKCTEPYRNRTEELACQFLGTLIAAWRARLPADLQSLPRESYETDEIEGLPITIGIHRQDLDGGHTLVAFQVLVHTWRKPTYLSLGAVGRMYAEGLIVSPDGVVSSAPDHEMWHLR